MKNFMKDHKVSIRSTNLTPSLSTKSKNRVEFMDTISNDRMNMGNNLENASTNHLDKYFNAKNNINRIRNTPQKYNKLGKDQIGYNHMSDFMLNENFNLENNIMSRDRMKSPIYNYKSKLKNLNIGSNKSKGSNAYNLSQSAPDIVIDTDLTPNYPTPNKYWHYSSPSNFSAINFDNLNILDAEIEMSDLYSKNFKKKSHERYGSSKFNSSKINESLPKLNIDSTITNSKRSLKVRTSNDLKNK